MSTKRIKQPVVRGPRARREPVQVPSGFSDDDLPMTPGEVEAVTGLTPTTQWRERKAGRFPQLLHLSENIRRNTRGQIRKWLTDKRAEAESRPVDVDPVEDTPRRGRPRKAPQQIAAE